MLTGRLLPSKAKAVVGDVQLEIFKHSAIVVDIMHNDGGPTKSSEVSTWNIVTRR